MLEIKVRDNLRFYMGTTNFLEKTMVDEVWYKILKKKTGTKYLLETARLCHIFLSAKA